TLALASSSPMVLIQATLTAFNLENTFKAVVSAEDLPYGKPHPEVYLNAAKAINVHPFDCIALEDSFTGLLAAKSAQMKTIVVPEAIHFAEPRFAIADLKLESLEKLTPEHLTQLV
ncbi:MAG: HAD-IA family hydrolase, partial [Vibrio sp.]